MDRGAWWATVQGVAELDMTEHTTLLEYILPLNAQGQKDDIVFLSFQRQKITGL